MNSSKWLFLLLLFSGCHPCVVQDSYHKQYRHLDAKRETLKNDASFRVDEYFLILLVDAKHLDYSDAKSLLSTIAKHPNGSWERTVGHAWIVVGGIKEGRQVVIEGGHSGELGIVQPRYLEGVLSAQHDLNPVRYLFSSLSDGYFEMGAGIHKPTYAIYKKLDQQTFLKIYDLIQPERYCFSNYSLTENQCTTFAVKIAALSGIILEHEVTIRIPQYIHTDFYGARLKMWEDPKYEWMTIPTPDILEKSMIAAVQKGHARTAMRCYRRQFFNKSKKMQ